MNNSEKELSASLLRARVIGEERNLYRVQTDSNELFLATISGKMQFTARARPDFPAVGDWVLVDIPKQTERVIIHEVCPRKTVIQRQAIGGSGDVQILASNVDYIFITTSMNEDLNFRRLDRYLAIAWDSGAIPIILLTKADLCPERVSATIAETEQKFPGVSIHSLSQQNYEAEDFFPSYLKEGKTAVVIGSSGVGKSTLVNFLIGREEIKTQEIRAEDGRGRHTTTSRALYKSRYGGLIIDTPGMRSLGLSDQDEGLAAQFGDIEEMINACRFSDCQHLTEPGCVVLQSLEDNSLSPDRWENYQKLAREVRAAARKKDKVLAAQDRKQWKKRAVEARQRGISKRRG